MIFFSFYPKPLLWSLYAGFYFSLRHSKFINITKHIIYFFYILYDWHYIKCPYTWKYRIYDKQKYEKLSGDTLWIKDSDEIKAFDHLIEKTLVKNSQILSEEEK